MLRQFMRRRARDLKAAYRTYIKRETTAYEASSWWDESFFTQGLSDRQTISAKQNEVTAAYHYASIELLILRQLRQTRFELEGKTVCDIGAGAGHWLDFYRARGATRCTGIDVSERSVEFLRNKYAGQDGVTIHHGKAGDVLGKLPEPVDVVNAIGVMFHIVDDQEWESTIRSIGTALKPGGLFIAGGEFGWLDGINVHFDQQRRVNKRLRSLAHWKRSLRAAGFASVAVHRNHAYLFIEDRLPENNVLVATKG